MISTNSQTDFHPQGEGSPNFSPLATSTETSIVKIDAKKKGAPVHQEISRRNIVRKNCDNESEAHSFADNLLTYGRMPSERQ